MPVERGKRFARTKRLQFPIVVKPLKEEASYGIAQASFVETDEQFKERVQFIHEKYDNDASKDLQVAELSQGKGTDQSAVER